MSLNTPDLSKMRRPARLIVHCTTVVLLLASISLSLLVLLTPTYGYDLSMFTLRPIGRERAPIALSPISNNTATDRLSPTASSASWSSSISGRQESGAKASQRDNETPERLEVLTTRGPADEPAGSADKSFGRTMYAWLSLHGPSIYVGVMREQMQICSKADDRADVSCTSASQGAYHAAFLPHNLQDALLGLPRAAPVPIHVLVGGTSALLATLVYLYGMLAPSALATRLRHIRRRANILRRYPRLTRHVASGSATGASRGARPDSPDSMTTLVNPMSGEIISPEGERKRSPHLAFFVLAVSALALVIAASAVELVVVHQAKRRWNEEDAARLGMKFEIGMLAYLIVCLPIVMLLAIISAFVPGLHARLHRGEPDAQVTILQRAESLISVDKISPPQHLHSTVTRIPGGMDTHQPRSAFPAANRENRRNVWSNEAGAGAELMADRDEQCRSCYVE